MIQPYMNNNVYPQNNPYMIRTIDTNNNILWVDGEVGAKAYPLYGMNNGVILMDREEDTLTLYQKMYQELMALGDVAGATEVLKLVKDVEKELQQAEQYQLYKKAMNYDMPTIVQEQQR